MAVSYSHCLQSLTVAPGSRFFLSRVDGRRDGRIVFSPKGKNNRIMKSYSPIYASSARPQQDFSLEAKVETMLDCVKWDDKGLAVAIAQNVDTGAVLMQGFVNRDALATTISTRKATFYSRSRSKLWIKGETSSNFINIHDIFLDCDRDSIIYLGKPDGPTCHTGAETCYYSSVFDMLKEPQDEERNDLALTTLYSLESTISQRKAEIASPQNGKPSWTKKLLLNDKLLCSKIREEADELCRAQEENEDKSRTASEMADVLYHTMVLLSLKDVKMKGCSLSPPRKIFPVRKKKKLNKDEKILLNLIYYSNT